MPPTGPQSPSVTLAAETESWHAGRLKRLRAPDGWLSVVGLEWLEPGPNRVGRGPQAQVRYDGFPADHIGTLTVAGTRLRFEPAPGVVMEGLPADGIIAHDGAGAPTVLALGGIRFHVIERGGKLGVRIKDAAAPALAEFAGIERYPVDPAWRITAEFVPPDSTTPVAFDTVAGIRMESPSSGRVRFRHAGVDVDAVLFRDGNVSLLRFADATNGRGTYSIGRYLVVEHTAEASRIVLDFNRAYNPPCALTPFATCSLPLPSNSFPFPIAAGERWPAAD